MSGFLKYLKSLTKLLKKVIIVCEPGVPNSVWEQFFNSRVTSCCLGNLVPVQTNTK